VGQYRAEYFPNRTLTGDPAFTRCEASIDYLWDLDGPAYGVGHDTFSARWTGRFDFGDSAYTFFAKVDDGIRVWVGDELVIDAWRDQGVTEYQQEHWPGSGEHQVKVEYYEHLDFASARVWWEPGCSVGQYSIKHYENPDLKDPPTEVRCQQDESCNIFVEGDAFVFYKLKEGHLERFL